MTDQQQIDKMYAEQAAYEAQYAAYMEQAQAEMDFISGYVPPVERESDIAFTSEISEKTFEEVKKPEQAKAAEVEQTEELSADKKEKTAEQENEGILMAQKAADEVSAELLTARRYTNLTDINSDIVDMVKKADFGDMFPTDDINVENATEVMDMLLRMADEHNNAEAQNIIGVCYMTGTNIPMDISNALDYFAMAAENGHTGGMRNLAIALEINGSKDKDKIITMYDKAAKNGDPYALNNLAVCYMTGDGVKKDMKQAINLFEKAVNADDTLSMVNLADCYSVGNGVIRNESKAFELYKKAADNGSIEGMRSAAIYLFEGKGTKQDLKAALEYFKQAADLGDEISKKRYDEISAKMQLKKHEDVSVNNPAPQKKSALSAILDRGRQAQANDAAAKAAPEKTAPDVSIGKGGGR